MSTGMYAAYLRERTNDEIIETDEGFATYRYLENCQVYLIDIYVVPDYRRRGCASAIADQVRDRARKAGCKEMIGTVVPSTKGARESMLALIGYGMRPVAASENLVIFKMEI